MWHLQNMLHQHWHRASYAWRGLHGIRLDVVKHPEAKQGFVLLPRRWVVERSFAWAVRFRRLAKDYKRLPETVAGLHFVAFATLMLPRIFTMLERAEHLTIGVRLC